MRRTSTTWLSAPVVLGVGVLLTIGTGAGLAVAAIPDSGTGLVHACYTSTSGALRVIDIARHQHCKTGERSLTWNQRGVNWRGTWHGTTKYSRNDAVSYHGSSYLALKANHGVAPTTTTTWAVLASAGAAGAPGQPGQPGQQGPPGPGMTAFLTPGTYTWTVPAGVTNLVVEVWAGGGGGGGGGSGFSGSSNSGGGGGAGGGQGNWTRELLTVTAGQSFQVVVGAGGAGGAGQCGDTVTADGNGALGAETKFGSLIDVMGGFGGAPGAPGSASGAGSSGNAGIGGAVKESTLRLEDRTSAHGDVAIVTTTPAGGQGGAGGAGLPVRVVGYGGHGGNGGDSTTDLAAACVGGQVGERGGNGGVIVTPGVS